MGLKAGDVRITGRIMDHAKGAWAGARPNWWTATHEATGFSVTWHECCDVAQHKQRDAALACLDLMIETMGAKCPPLATHSYPQREVATVTGKGSQNSNNAIRGQDMQAIGYIRAGHEFDIRDELKSDGYAATVPRKVETVSRGKDRRPKLEDVPLLPNYVFLDCTVAQYHRLLSSKGQYKYLASTFQIIPARLEANMSRWAAGIEAAAQKEIERYRRGEELSLFTKGEALHITHGPFAEWLEGQHVTFRRMVQAAHDTFPRAEVDVELFGRVTRVEVDPLHIRRA